MSRLDPATAWAEALEDRALTCETCDAPSEEDGPHCQSCRLYWEDVRNGVFEREFMAAALDDEGAKP